ncbi:sigma factor [Entomobacter blattae]|uniref:ECF RNA polymerase sigma factor EcfG n=1 Tax=Entomobacter blattae TaxID=2762277 RepID=A0A7H1NS27_9PROT|nr:sigma factor [Entomobacter blattae]QNT78587.1 ECF RNA polymerase sigma factor EcfG [Entomobacter blattae]
MVNAGRAETVDDFSGMKQEIVKYLPAMRAFARFLTRDAAQADDLLQETLVKVMDNLDKFTPLPPDIVEKPASEKPFPQNPFSEKPFSVEDPPLGEKVLPQKIASPWKGLKAWLLTIERNVYYGYLRKTRREQKGLQVFHDEAPVFQAENAATADAVWDLEQNLAQLSPPLREALILVGGQQLSYEEAARICGIGIGTFKARVSRARKQLAALYEHHHEKQSRQKREENREEDDK